MRCLLLLVLLWSCQSLAAGFSQPVVIDGQLRSYQPTGAASEPWRICVLIPNAKDRYWWGVTWGLQQEAQRLGMRNTHFMNATGLPDPQHITTARDLAVLASHLISDHPDFFHYYKQKEYTYNKITQPNRNRLLWADPSVDGMKTGHTDSAGYCLVTTAMRGDRRILTVLVGADSEATRAEESLKLLNWSFQNFDTIKLYGQNQPGLDARVWEGKAESVKLGPPNAVWLAVPRGKGGEIKPVAQRTDPLVAPITKGQQVGTVQLTLDGKTLRTEPLVAQEDVERAGFFGRMGDMVKRWFQ